MFRTFEENIEFVKSEHTAKQWCECIVDMMEDSGITRLPTPEQIWNYSPSGELSVVFALIQKAKQYWSEGITGCVARSDMKALVIILDRKF